MSSDEQEEILRAPHGQAAGKLGHKKQKFRKVLTFLKIGFNR